MRRTRRRALRRAWPAPSQLLVAVVLLGCTPSDDVFWDEVPIDDVALAVHVVLDPAVDSQRVYVSPTAPVELRDIRVVATDADGNTVVGSRFEAYPEDSPVPDCWALALNVEYCGWLHLRPRGRVRYRVRIEAEGVAAVAGETVVPQAPQLLRLDVRGVAAGDTVPVEWSDADGAHGYVFVVAKPRDIDPAYPRPQPPVTLFSLWTRDTRATVGGSTRKTPPTGAGTVHDPPIPIWQPGERRIVHVSAVDRNLYEYATRGGGETIFKLPDAQVVQGGYGVIGSSAGATDTFHVPLPEEAGR